MTLVRTSATRLFTCALALAATTMAGDLTARYRLSLDRIERGGPPHFDMAMITADAAPKHVRRFTEFSGDVSGRYLDAMAAATSLTGESSAAWKSVLEEILRLQKPDGHFGAEVATERVNDAAMAIMWGNGRMLIGLLEAYDATHDQKVLAAAVKLGNWMVALAPLMNSDATLKLFNDGKAAVGYICWTQNIEGMVRLNEITHDARYLALAREMAARTSFRGGQHSHGHLSSLRGIVRLYEATHDAQLLEQVEKQYHDVISTGNLLPEGAVPELYHPQMRRDEGCSEADWLRLSLDLFRVSKKREYLDLAERTLFNELAVNQFAQGDFGHRLRSDSDQGLEPGFLSGGGAARAWWCCLFHGLRAITEVMRTNFAGKDGGTAFLLPVDGRGRNWKSDSSLGKDGTVKLTADAGAKGDLWVRVPAWGSVTARINGAAVTASSENGWLRVARAWKKGDAVVLSYAMNTRLEKYAATGAMKGAAGRLLLWHGPWLLGVDQAGSPNFYDEPRQKDRLQLPAVAADQSLELAPVADTSAGAFSVPVAHFRLNYLPGGYPLQPGTATLRPIAEQTGLPTTAWTFLFVPEEK